VIRGIAAVLLAFTMSAAYASKEKLPEVSSDGLHLVKSKEAAIVYVKPGATLAPYSKVKLIDCTIVFQKNWQRDYNLSEVGIAGQVSDKDAEEIKTKLAAEFKKEFTKVLTKEGHEVVDDTGPGILIVRPALINVDINDPQTMASDFSRTWIRSAGEMTLYMELYDSADSTLLARVIDPQADNSPVAQMGGVVANRAAADRILTHWAELLAKHLGNAKATTQ
jgi:hypothetical protein